MAPNKKTEIEGASVSNDAPYAEGVLIGGFEPEAGDEAELPSADVSPQPEGPAPADPEHKDIGNWMAVYWRGRAMWRHRRSGQTMFKKSEVWRLRNLK